MEADIRMTVFVSGRVQQVGFRWWTRAQALALGLAGHAFNTADGRVEVTAEGPRADVERLLDRIVESPSMHRRPGHVKSVSGPLWGTPRGDLDGFVER